LTTILVMHMKVLVPLTQVLRRFLLQVKIESLSLLVSKGITFYLLNFIC
jgi:hypothetical protein